MILKKVFCYKECLSTHKVKKLFVELSLFKIHVDYIYFHSVP